MLKNTVFGINRNKGNYLGFFLFYDLMVYVLPSLLLLNSLAIDNFWVAFKVKQDSVFWISLVIIASLFFFFISLKFIANFDNRTFKPSYQKFEIDNLKRPSVFFLIAVVFCLVLIIFSYLVFNVGHSFSLSLISDESISSIRFGITERKETKFIKHLFTFITPLLTAVLASGIFHGKLKNILGLICICFIASWGGSKGPLLTVFIIYAITILSFRQIKIKIKLKTMVSLLFFISALLFVTYRIVLFQYSHLEGQFGLFMNYFSQRVFVAQMIGTYEQFNLLLQDPQYIFHGIPFASSFADFPVFQKDLMLISEDRSDAGSIGIKNTLFIAEAYSMGGVLLLMLSPLWMALVFALNFKLMLYIINRFIFKNYEYAKRVVAISLFSYVTITGGFSDLMFFKITILMILLMTPFILGNWVINLKKK